MAREDADAPGRLARSGKAPPVVLDVKVKARVRRPGEQTAATSTLTLHVSPGDTLELALVVKETRESGSS